MGMHTRFLTMSLIASIGVVLLILAAVAMVLYVIYYYVIAGLLAPTRRVMARVLVKRQRERFGGSSYCTDEYADTLKDGNDEVSYDFYIIFEVGARRLEFPVPMSVYADIDEGDTGLLVHKGNLFRSFIKGAGGWSDPVQAPIRKVDQ